MDVPHVVHAVSTGMSFSIARFVAFCSNIIFCKSLMSSRSSKCDLVYSLSYYVPSTSFFSVHPHPFITTYIYLYNYGPIQLSPIPFLSTFPTIPSLKTSTSSSRNQNQPSYKPIAKHAQSGPQSGNPPSGYHQGFTRKDRAEATPKCRPHTKNSNLVLQSELKERYGTCSGYCNQI